MTRTTARDLLILSLLCYVAFWWRLGQIGLIDPDEPFYAQTAREMVETNDWITPHIFGAPQFEKPIFYYWLVAASFKLFGQTEFERLVVRIRRDQPVLRVALVTDRHVGQKLVEQSVGHDKCRPHERAFDEPVLPRAQQKQQRPCRKDAHAERAVEILLDVNLAVTNGAPIDLIVAAHPFGDVQLNRLGAHRTRRFVLG